MVDRVRRHACHLWPSADGEHHSLLVLPISYRNVIRGTQSGLPLCLARPNCIPAEDKSSKKSANQDTDNDVSIIVHCQQHDEISYSELQYIQESCCKLLLGVRLA
jgi:hypothetical protein